MRLIQLLHIEDPIAAGLSTLALAVTLGLCLGAIRFRGMRLGISGVLFSALVFGQLNLTVDPNVLHFLRDFALILFIYALGLQVGPAFATSLRAEGLRLNFLSVVVLVLGATMSGLVVKLGRLPRDSSAGVYAGAFTTTPGLAAGQEAVRQKQAPSGIATAAPGAGADQDPTAIKRNASEAAQRTMGLAYSVTYPFGVVGPIFVIVLLRRLFKVDLKQERAELAAAQNAQRPAIETADFEVTQGEWAQLTLRDHPLLRKNGIIFSRLLRAGALTAPTAETVVQIGDIYRAVGARASLAELVEAMGRVTTVEMGRASGDVRRVNLVVTRTQVLRRTLQELDLIRRHGVTVVRVTRNGIDLAPSANLRLAFADSITAVGPEAGLKEVESEVGNNPESLNRPQLVPIFLGIVMGVIVGTLPLAIPGMHTTLRIGLAGGPLLAAIVLSQFGNLGSIVWYMPAAANALFRDFGLAVFLACVGLESGDNLIARVINPHDGGLWFVLWGAVVTILPCFIVACLARWLFKMNFFTLSGWVAGAMTSTTALAFANELAESDAPAVPYAAVAPLATLVPIVCAQLLALGTL